MGSTCAGAGAGAAAAAAKFSAAAAVAAAALFNAKLFVNLPHAIGFGTAA